MAKEPSTVSEHIIALYGHIKGLKREVFNIKQNHLKHMHEDIDRLHVKNGSIFILASRRAWSYCSSFTNNVLVIYLKKFILIVGALERPTLLTV